MVPLLPRSIPNLKLHSRIIHRQRLREEGRPDRRFLPSNPSPNQNPNPQKLQSNHQISEFSPGIR